MMITQSAANMSEMEIFFDANPLNSVQSPIGTCLMIEVYK